MIPVIPGAYVLAIELSIQVAVSLRGKPSALLPPGLYLYCGSAKGPGGLRGRLARHMRRGKSIRWHIDVLTEGGTVLGAWTFPGGDECDLITGLSHLPVAIKGFGNTDCRRCTSHLLRWPHMPDSLIPTVPAVAKVHPARLSPFPALESGQCPQPAEADISPKGADSRFDPERSLAGCKLRSAASL